MGLGRLGTARALPKSMAWLGKTSLLLLFPVALGLSACDSEVEDPDDMEAGDDP